MVPTLRNIIHTMSILDVSFLQAVAIKLRHSWHVKDPKIIAIENDRRLIDMLKAFNIIYPNGDYEKILKAINELVLKYNA